MSNFYTGKIICNSCKEENPYFCISKNIRWGEENPPIGAIQMSHGYSYLLNKEEFSGHCRNCDKLLKLPDEEVSKIPQEYFTDL